MASTRTVAPHQFLPRRRSLGQELRFIANRSSQPDIEPELGPISHRKRPASVDNSQLDKCPRNLDTLFSSPRRTRRLAKPKAKTNRPCSLPIKTSSPLAKMALDNELRNHHLYATEQKVSDFIIQALSPRAVNSPDPFTSNQMIAAHQALLGVPGLERHSSRRVHRLNPPMPKHASRPARLHPVITNQPQPVRLSVSPTAIRDQPFTAFFGQQAGFSIASSKGMTTSPTDPAISVQSTPGTFSRGTTSPATPQNVPATTQFFPVLGHYLPATSQGYYFQQFNGTQTAHCSQYGNRVWPFYPAPLQNRQYHQALGTGGNPVGQYHPSYDGLQAGPYVGSLTPNNLSPSLSTQNNPLYYQIPVVNNEYQYVTASNSPLYAQNFGDQTAWNCSNRLASPNQTMDGYNQATQSKTLPFSQSVDIYQRLQANGAGVSPSRLCQFVYQTPGLTLAMDNHSVLYPVSSAQSGYQTNCDGLNVMGQPGPLHSPKIHNSEQGLPFILSDVGPPPRKKMSAAQVSQTSERPRTHPSENQWISHSVSQWQRNLH